MQSLSQQAGKIRPVMDDSAAASSNSGGSGPKNNGLRQEILLAIGQMLKPV
ncbi:MAG: hypothetical protein JO295_02485, partial [Verrucomicrobia bacterium]|nr:hypothetical protein [Verrucomicrobiota bacterium]